MPNLDVIYAKCMREIAQASAGKISEDEAKDILKAVRRDADSLMQQKGLTAEQAVNDLIARRAKSEELEAAQRKWEEVLRTRAEAAIWKRLESGPDKVSAYQAFLEGTNSIFAGARDSIDVRQHAISKRALGGMMARMRSENLVPYFTDPAHSDDIAREMFKLGRTPEARAAMDAARPAANPQVRRVAEIIHETQAVLLQRARRAGAPIQELEGYMWRQGHDMLRIRSAGFDAWKAKIGPSLDWAKIAEQSGGDVDPDKFLQATYEALSSGVHLQPDGSLAPVRSGRETVALSAHRKLHFKDADSWLAYNREFGTANFFEGVTQGVQRVSRSVALMERMGPNPQAMHEKIVARVKTESRTQSELIDRLNNIDVVFNNAVGKNLIPGNPRTAQIAQMARKVISMQSLGGAGVASIVGDPNVAALELKWQGHNPLSAILDLYAGQVKNFGQSEQKQFAEALGIVAQADMANALSRFDLAEPVTNATDRAGRAINWAYDKFFRLNLLQGSTDASKTTFSMLMSNRLAQVADRTFDKLPAQTVRMLEMGNIKAGEWDVLRAHGSKVGGGRYWTADAARSVTDDELRPLLKAEGLKDTALNLQRYRDDLDTRISGMFYDRTAYALTEQGARERRLMLLNHDLAPGTAAGEAWRFVMQFKGYPVTYMMRTMGREMASNGGTFAKMQAFGVMAAQLTAAGYVTMVAQDALAGKTPPDPTKLSTFYAAAVKGGGYGLLTDYMFGEYIPGRDPIAGALGPAAGKLSALMTIRAKAMGGEDITTDLTRFARSNIPGQNLIWFKGMIDFTLNHHLNETLSPGYMDRMEKRMEEDRGQRFFFRQ